MRRRWLVSASLFVAFALVAAACGDDDVADTTTTTTTTAAPTTTAPDPGDEVAYDVGVTPAPCPDAVNDGNGCIYLGIISDLTDGPFRAFGVPLTLGQEGFWARVNAAGGIGGFDVVISPENTFDAHYLADATAEGFELLVDRVLAFAQILGTPQTQAVIPRMMEESVVGAPASWWSGWNFSASGGDQILESGAPYCFEAMNGMYFMSQALPEGFTWAMIRFPGDFGGDYGAGALIAAAQLGLGDPLFDHLQIPISFGGDTTEAVTLAATHQPTLLVLATGPTETAQIVGGAFAAGHTQFQVLGVSPSWHPALLDIADLVPLLEAVLKVTYPWAPWDADTPGHAAVREAAAQAGIGPDPGFLAGWVWQYPIKALLEQAVATNDLTRANLLAISGELADIDYEGMLPSGTYAGTPDAAVERTTMVLGVDAQQTGGVAPLSDFFVSPIVAAFDFAGPCFVG